MDSRYRHPLGTYAATLARASLWKSLWYSLRFRARVLVGRGSKVRVHRSARLEVAAGGLLAVGVSSASAVGATVELRPRSSLRVGGFVQVMGGALVRTGWDAHLAIGDATYLNEGAIVTCDERMEIGARCAIAQRASIMDGDGHQLAVDGEPRQRNAPVRVGDDCWLGTGAIVLKGVDVGEGAVVAAGAVVTEDVAPRSLVAGVPARERSSDVSWTG